MNIYDETTGAVLSQAFVDEKISEGKGEIYAGRIKVGMTAGVDAHYVHAPNSETDLYPEGFDYLVPERKPEPIYEDCMYYRSKQIETATWQDRIEAQVLYTAMLTDSVLEV